MVHDPVENAIACSWSGGKDSCYALMKRLRQGGTLKLIMNMMNESGRISRSHGLPQSILEQQARQLNVPLLFRASGWNDYEQHFIDLLREASSSFGVNEIVFGDIDLQAHRDWEEMVCTKASLTASLPLWKRPRKELVFEMIDNGIEASIVSCNSILGPAFIGRRIDAQLVAELIDIGVDPCGEEGEYHTVVTDCPLFSTGIGLPSFDVVKHNDYWFAVFDQ